MNIERGDSIKFGEIYCKEYNREDLFGKIVKLTPQYFENDNGLYVSTTECPGIYDEANDEPESIYHLFGNNLENIMDCQLIKGTIKDKEEYEKIIQDQIDTEAKLWEEFCKDQIDAAAKLWDEFCQESIKA